MSEAMDQGQPGGLAPAPQDGTVVVCVKCREVEGHPNHGPEGHPFEAEAA